MMDLLKIKNGMFSLNNTQVNLETSMKPIVEELMVATNEKGINLNFSLEESVPSPLTIDI